MIRIINLLEFAQKTSASKSKRGGRMCDVSGCPNTTREGKPFCSDHIDQHPYVQQLLTDLATMDDERERLAKPSAKVTLDLDSENVKAILSQLSQHGERTLERLAKDTQIPLEAIRKMGRALSRKKMVTFSRTKRKGETLRLYQEPAQPLKPTTATEISEPSEQKDSA